MEQIKNKIAFSPLWRGFFATKRGKMRGRVGAFRKKGGKTIESTAFCYLRIENYPCRLALFSVESKTERGSRALAR